MGRIAFGVDNMMRAVLEAANGGSSIERPVETLRFNLSQKGTPLHDMSIRKYLEELREQKFIALTYGGPRGGQITRLTVLKKEVPVIPAPAAAPPAPIPMPEERPPEKKTVTRVIALVDFDNIRGDAQEAGFVISFTRMKEYIRTFGDQVLFADVFVSPAGAAKTEMIAQLWNAGFHVIMCPMASKDKDAVDSKMNWRARQYISATNVNLVLIFSKDRDFRELADFAADFGKDCKVAFVDIVAQRGHLEGHNALVPLTASRQLAGFEKAVEYLARGLSGVTQIEGQRVLFLKQIIRVMCDRESRNNAPPFPFKQLESYVWDRVAYAWKQIFSISDLGKALTALHESKVILKNEGDRMNYYTINQASPAVRKTLNR